jgi:ATP-dependent RNA helicase DDX24/MAK5
MGEGATGSSLSLVAPAEDKAHNKIVESLKVTFHKVLLDGRLLTSSQERTNLACKIIAVEEMQQKVNSSNRWFLEKAKEAELDLDDDLVEDESNRTEKEQQRIREAKKARIRLAKLLSEPMKTQRFGKFLSTNSAAVQNELKQPIAR